MTFSRTSTGTSRDRTERKKVSNRPRANRDFRITGINMKKVKNIGVCKKTTKETIELKNTIVEMKNGVNEFDAN